MARAPETAYYFEPIAERLALVLEGSPYPSDDHWAFVGDPTEMTEELARLEIANRWPGVDPGTLTVEFDTNFERALAELERVAREEAEKEPGSGEIPFDVNFLLQEAEALRAQAAEARAEAEQTVGEAIAKAFDE